MRYSQIATKSRQSEVMKIFRLEYKDWIKWLQTVAHKMCDANSTIGDAKKATRTRS